MFLDSCLVCRVHLSNYDSVVSTTVVVEGSHGRTVKLCVERVLETKINSLTDSFICSKCFSDLVQIQSYYCLVEDFRNRYKRGLQKQMPSSTHHAPYHDPMQASHGLMLPPVDSSILLEPNNPTFDLLGMGFPPPNQAFFGSCRYESTPPAMPTYGREPERNSSISTSTNPSTSTTTRTMIQPETSLSTEGHHSDLAGHVDEKPNKLPDPVRVPERISPELDEVSLPETGEGGMDEMGNDVDDDDDNTDVYEASPSEDQEDLTPDKIKQEALDVAEMPPEKGDKVSQAEPHIHTPDNVIVKEAVIKLERLSPSLTEKTQCQVCNKVFETQVKLKRHMISHTGSGPFKCAICKKGFSNERTLSFHLMTHENGDDWKRKRRRLLLAPKPATKGKPDGEGRGDSNPEGAIEVGDGEGSNEGQSEDSEANNIHNKCTLCGKNFTKLRELKLHKVEVHGKDGCLVCPECGEQFAEASELRAHLNNHYEDVGNWKCHVCGSVFRRESRLRIHLKNNCRGKSHICSLCGKAFSSPAGLSNHIRIHTGEKPYECSYCKGKFNNSSNYKAHLRIHTGETPYKCSVCGLAFTQSGQRNIHEATHAEEPAYSCEICGKGFYWPTAYKKHIRVHSDVRTHLCSLCGKKFRDLSSLKNHLRTHSDLRPYKCNYCEKGFKSPKHRKVHERIHTGEKPYICHRCGRRFTQATGLKFHMKTHKNDAATATV